VGLSDPAEEPSKPRFAPAFWSQFDHAIKGLPLTDNPAEGLNHSLGLAMGKHPSLWQWVKRLRGVMGTSRLAMAEGSRAGPPKTPTVPSLALGRRSSTVGDAEWQPLPRNYKELCLLHSRFKGKTLEYLKLAAQTIP
jgi:hypothetical protein